MPWAPDPFTGGVIWQDKPSVATALSAANLNQEENAEAAYAVALSQSVVDHFTAQLAVNAKDYAKGDGTDDTAGLQNAINATSAVGTAIGAPVRLVIPGGSVYLTGPLTPKSYVDIWAYGAVLKRNPADVTDHPIFWCNPAVGAGSPITEFAVRGARMGGTGSETSFQGFLLIAQSDHITIKDCHIHDLPANAVYLLDCQNLWVEHNRFINCTVQNPVNFVSGAHGNTVPLQTIWCNRNLLTGFNVLGIGIVSASGSNRTDPVVDAHITDNTCVSSGTCTGWPIAVEQGGATGGGAPNVSRIDISGNTCVQNGAGLYAVALTNDSTPLSNDPLCMSAITIRGNRLVSLGAGGVGLLSLASRVSITGNEIEAAVDDIKLQGHGTAAIDHITIGGNVGHLGSGQFVNVIAGNGTTTGHVDTTTLSSSNTQ